MQRYPFIFSSEKKWKLRRHILFWLSWWAFQSFLYAFSSFGLQIPYFKRFPLSVIEALFFLIPHMFLAYTLMYWAVPKLLLRGKYALTVAGVAMLFLATAFISSLIAVYILKEVRIILLGRIYMPPPHIDQINIFIGLLAGLRGAITIGGMAAAIKLMKYWYMKEQRNLQLQKENMDAHLQLLKAQIHPHFLFNTLNNIYSYTQDTAPVASRMVMGLSEMLRYMLYECNQPMVPLSKDLKLLQDYILLEQTRYNHQLDINLDLPSDTDDLYIAPLLLLPLVENCFKHGTSQVLEHPWVSLHVSLEGSYMKMKLLNGKAPGYVPAKTEGIGIENVKKRLDLIYPGKYFLKVNNGEDIFVVNLRLELTRIKGIKETRLHQTTVHAG